MNGRRRRDSRTFAGKLTAALFLMGIIPWLLFVYLVVHEGVGFSGYLVLVICLSMFSILCGYFLLRSSAAQLFSLSAEIGRAVARGQRNGPIRIEADRELRQIAGHFNALYEKLEDLSHKNQEQATQLMIYARDLALSYQRSKREEELRNRLSRYVGNNLVEKLINLKDGVFLETERRNVTVFFADIRSFTAVAERMPAEEVVAMLNEYFSVMVDIIFKNGGLLDKFVGDQIIAVFGLVKTGGDAPGDAIRTAVEIQDAAERMKQKRSRAGREYFEVGIGINTGTAIIGNIGSSNRMDYTVIGDCVNVAARLEQMAKGGEIVIGEQTYLACTQKFAFESRGRVHVKNKLEPVVCYNVLRA